MKSFSLLIALFCCFSVLGQTLIPTDLYMSFPLDGNAIDVGGYNYTGTIFGGVTATTDRFDNASKAMLFNGTTGYIDIPYATSVGTLDFSVSYWANPAGTNTGFVFTKEQTNVATNQFRMGSSGDYFGCFSDNTNLAYGGGLAYVPATNVWSFYTIIRQGASIKLYVNGVYKSALNTAGTINHSNTLNYRIGLMYSGSTFFNGKIDDLRMFKHALSAGEIAALYAYGNPPVITSFTPVNGTIGTSVTLTGTGFSATPADNIVYFGAVRATVSASTATSITVTVPAGAGSIVPLTVTENSGIAYSTTCTTPRFTYTNTPNIVPKYWTSTLGTGSQPYSVAVSDFNMDGKADIVTANYNSNTVSVLLGNDIGSFTTATDFAVGTHPWSVAVGDFNGDGIPDIAAANYSSNTVSILIGNGTGSFGAATSFATGTMPMSVAVGDFNGDGKADLATANNQSTNVSILLGTGTGSFGAVTNLALGVSPYSLAIGDFNGDHKADIATANYYANTVSILIGTGTGTFAAAVNYSTGTGPNSIAVGDFNGDGKADLTTSNYTSNNVSVLLGNGNGTFGSANGFSVVDGPSSVAIGDFNGDGKADIVASHDGVTYESILIGNGAGSFAASTHFTNGNYCRSIAVGDFNGDGKADMVATNSAISSVSVMMFTAPTVISSFSPVSGVAGNTVTITGTGFSANASDNTVFFGAVKATVTASTLTSITITVPAGAGSVVPVSVTVKGNVAYSNTCTAPFFTFTNTPNLIAKYQKNNIGSGQTYRMTAIGDFNCDGFPDMAAPTNSDFIRVFPGNGDGTFAPASDYVVGTNPMCVAIGDFNADGYSDLVSANSGSNNISILLSTGACSFSAAVTYSVATTPYSVAVGDFNNDGKADIATANYGSNNVSVLLGTGTGGFGAATNFTAGTNPWSLVTGDFNSDGKADIAVSNRGSFTASVLIGNGTGGFAAAASYGVGLAPFTIATGDFNQDGKADLVTANNGLNTVSVLLNTGTGTFGTATDYVAGTNPTSVAIGDFNGDGKTDICTSNDFDDNVSILLGAGTGSFGTANTFSSGNNPVSIAVGDFNRDGRAEMAVTNSYSQDISLLLWGIPVVITSISPVSGPVGTSVTITGAGFSAVLSDNIVWFGAIKGTVTAASSSGITAIVPAGAGSVFPVSVMVNGAIAYSTSSSTPTFNITNSPNLNLVYTKNDVNSGLDHPTSVAISDFNGDGKADLVLGNVSSSFISVLLGDGNGGWAAAVFYQVGFEPRTLTIGDFNGDGKVDIATANTGQGSVSVLIGNGNGTFATATSFSVGYSPSSIAVGDFNGDGKVDLAAANYGSNTVSVLMGNGSGGFATAVPFSVGDNPNSVAVGDFNGDGKVDLVTTNFGSYTGSVLIGDGSGGFATAVPFSVGDSPYSVVVGDFNGDGKPDLAISCFYGVSVLMGQGQGDFAAAISFFVEGMPQAVSIGDFNGDGKTDIATANYFSDNVSVLVGDGLGGFAAAVNYGTGTGSNPSSIAVGDFNRDGKADMASLNVGLNTVSVCLNASIGITTQAVTEVGSSTATGNGNIIDLGITNPTAYGVCWNTTGTPTTSDSKVDNGATSSIGPFTALMAGLTANTIYYVRTYATNTGGTSYGNELSFTTRCIPSWTGTTSTDWNNAANWLLNQTPITNEDIIIPSGAPNWPTFTGNFAVGNQCKNLIIQSGAQITITGNLNINNGSTISNSGNIKVGGSWVNQGIYMPGAGNVEFIGESTSSITPNPTNTLGYLINDDFTSFPGNWHGNTGSSNGQFSQQSTQWAGGSVPEVWFKWVNSISTRRMYQVVNTTGKNILTFQFHNTLNDNNGAGGYTILVEYSTDGINWNSSGWSISPTTDIPANLVNIYLTSAQGVGSATYYISFTVTGNLNNIKYWHIDNVKLFYQNEAFNNLTINKTMPSCGVNLSGSTTVTGTLTLTKGLLNLGNNNLMLGANALIAGTPSAANMVVATGSGEMRKAFAAPGSFTFPVGDDTGVLEYSPVSLDFTAGTFGTDAYAAVKLVNAPLNGTTTNYLNRYWNIAATGINNFTCNAGFNYLAADVTGDEAALMCVQSLPPDITVHGSANTILHQLTATGISSFGAFTGEGNSTNKTVTLSSVFPEGLYDGGGVLRQAQNETGAQWPAGVADHITVELHDAINYATIIYTATDVELSTSGSASLNIPAIFSGSYYVTVKHRNSIQITSAYPATFAGNTISKSFGAPADVFGGKLKQMSDLGYAIYGGDINQDGIVDAGDMIPVDNAAKDFQTGYRVTDLNGDGVTNANDMVILGVNSAFFVFSITP